MNSPGFTLVAALNRLSAERPVKFTVRGTCMSPAIPAECSVDVSPSRFYWPGDVLAFQNVNGELLVHRLIGYRWRAGFDLVTRADHAASWDVPTSFNRVIGKVIRVGQKDFRVRLSTRVRSTAVFLSSSCRHWTGAK